jgi:hypothetical protein
MFNPLKIVTGPAGWVKRRLGGVALKMAIAEAKKRLAEWLYKWMTRK